MDWTAIGVLFCAIGQCLSLLAGDILQNVQTLHKQGTHPLLSSSRHINSFNLQFRPLNVYEHLLRKRFITNKLQYANTDQQSFIKDNHIRSLVYPEVFVATQKILKIVHDIFRNRQVSIFFQKLKEATDSNDFSGSQFEREHDINDYRARAQGGKDSFSDEKSTEENNLSRDKVNNDELLSITKHAEGFGSISEFLDPKEDVPTGKDDDEEGSFMTPKGRMSEIEYKPQISDDSFFTGNFFPAKSEANKKEISVGFFTQPYVKNSFHGSFVGQNSKHSNNFDPRPKYDGFYQSDTFQMSPYVLESKFHPPDDIMMGLPPPRHIPHDMTIDLPNSKHGPHDMAMDLLPPKHGPSDIAVDLPPPIRGPHDNAMDLPHPIHGSEAPGTFAFMEKPAGFLNFDQSLSLPPPPQFSDSDYSFTGGSFDPLWSDELPPPISHADRFGVASEGMFIDQSSLCPDIDGQFCISDSDCPCFDFLTCNNGICGMKTEMFAPPSLPGQSADDSGVWLPAPVDKEGISR